MGDVRELLKSRQSCDAELQRLEQEHSALMRKFDVSRMQVTHSRLDLATLEVKRHESERMAFEGEEVLPWPPAQ